MAGTPKVAVLVPTYGRTAELDETIGDFLAQDYEGEMRLFVANDLEEQTLRSTNPNVVVHNAKNRHSSLGDTRNALAEWASSWADVLAMWDDDDVHLRNYISRMVAPYPTVDSYFLTLREGGQYRRADWPHPNTLTIPTKAFLDSGGYADISYAEDLELFERIRDGVRLVKGAAAYVYKTSGTPWKASKDSRSDIREITEARLSSGEEPSGVVWIA